MKDKQIRVIVKTVDGDWEIKTIDNALKPLQQIVGGHIEPVTLTGDYTLLCNEEGLVLGLPFNQRVFEFKIYGDFCIVRTHGDEFVTMNQEEAESIIRALRKKG